MSRRVASTARQLARLSGDELIHASWEAGNLRWLLQEHQLPCYDKYRAWEKLDSTKASGQFPRLFLLDISKRWGKTTLRLLTRIEDCLRHPGRHYRYTTAHEVNIEEILGDTLPPLLETCPDAIKPQFKWSSRTKKGPQPSGLYFHNGSSIRLAGLDKHPDALRGRASDGDDISEAAFIRKLDYAVTSILYQQYQRRPWARMCLESSAPLEPDTQYDTVYVADAKARDAYYFATIEDNTALSHEEREEFIKAAYGRQSPTCQREYFCIRSRPADTTVLPEFDLKKHVVPRRPSPQHAHCFVAADPGTQDLFALLWGYWDAERQKLVIQKSWAKRNASTSEVAAVIREMERELWSSTRYYEPTSGVIKQAPYLRVSDTELRTILDLHTEHRLPFIPSRKDNADAQLYALRNAFLANSIEIEDGGGPLADHCQAARWKENRSDWERTEAHGHFDCVDALMYLWRLVSGLRNMNPTPPRAEHGDYFVPPTVRKEPTMRQALTPDWRRRRR